MHDVNEDTGSHIGTDIPMEMAEGMTERVEFRQGIGRNAALFKPCPKRGFILKLWEAV